MSVRNYNNIRLKHNPYKREDMTLMEQKSASCGHGWVIQWDGIIKFFTWALSNCHVCGVTRDVQEQGWVGTRLRLVLPSLLTGTTGTRASLTRSRAGFKMLTYDPKLH